MVFNRPPKSGKGRSPSSKNPARAQTTSENTRSHKTLRPHFDKKSSQNFDSRADKKAYQDRPFHKKTTGSSENFRQDRAPRKNITASDRRENNDRFARNDRGRPNDRPSGDRFDRNNPKRNFSAQPHAFGGKDSSNSRYSNRQDTPHKRGSESNQNSGYRGKMADSFSSDKNPRAARAERFRDRDNAPYDNRDRYENRPPRFNRDQQRSPDRSAQNKGHRRDDGYKDNRPENRFSSNVARDRYPSEDKRSEKGGYYRNLAVNPSYSPDARPFRKKGISEPASARIPREHGEQRIAKLLSRAGIASRRMIEAMIAEGRIAIDGVTVEKPATLLTSLDGVTVDGKSVTAPTETRLFLYHKATGLLTTERDPEGRMTIYDRLPADLPRVMPVGRLDMNTEGLLLLTTDGGFKRALELPATHIERCYRARVFGDVSQDQLEELIEGVTIDGIHYGSIDANLERRTGRNGWVEMKLHEGRNREVRRVLGYLGLQVSRLIRISYGPFLLGDLPVGAVEEVDPVSLKTFKNSLPEMS